MRDERRINCVPLNFLSLIALILRRPMITSNRPQLSSRLLDLGASTLIPSPCAAIFRADVRLVIEVQARGVGDFLVIADDDQRPRELA